MITCLTPEQEALIPVIRDKWSKIALEGFKIFSPRGVESQRGVIGLCRNFWF